MSYVRGRDIDLYVYNTDLAAWDLVACGTSLSMRISAAEVAITTADSGREDEYEGGATNCEIDFSGMVTLNETTKWQYEDFVDAIGTKVRALVKFTDQGGSVLSYDMKALIRNVTASGEAGDFGLFDLSMIRSGPMTKLKTTGGGPGGPGGSNWLIDPDGNPIVDTDGNPIIGG